MPLHEPEVTWKPSVVFLPLQKLMKLSGSLSRSAAFKCKQSDTNVADGDWPASTEAPPSLLLAGWIFSASKVAPFEEA